MIFHMQGGFSRRSGGYVKCYHTRKSNAADGISGKSYGWLLNYSMY